MEKVYKDKKDCCGCSACMHICPVNAIEFINDKEGFQYPIINQEKCIDCHACENVCPFLISKSLKNSDIQKCYSLTHKEYDVLKNSTSGGAFTAMSDVILNMGGVIYGADFDEDYNIYHSRAHNKDLRNRQRFSKYAQSNLVGVFKKIKKDLENGIPVLFTGSPCQVAGLKAFIPEKLTNNLYLCDLICHSIPSPKVWKDYKKYQEEKYGNKMTKVMFRSKIHPWTRENSNKGFIFKLENDDKLYEDNIFYDLFFKVSTICRPACENCKFTSKDRVGDITMADYWGIEEYDKDAYNPLGVSVILTNNYKGEILLQKMKEFANINERDISEQLKHQKRLSEPVKYPNYREEFWNDYLNNDFAYVMDKYLFKK